MVKQPKKSSIGWRYAADICGSGFQVAGPDLHDTYFSRREDAEMVAAALNFALNFDSIKRATKALQDDLASLQEFK